jgi:hypothetical protein
MKILLWLLTGKPEITANGPAIKGGCVAERMKAGAVKPNRGRVLVPARAERLKIALWRAER